MTDEFIDSISNLFINTHGNESLRSIFDRIEWNIIRKYLKIKNNNKTAVARKMNIKRTCLEQKIKKYSGSSILKKSSFLAQSN